jgi:predicted RNA-binding Zn-ribbon protein involved in translation (DUF1610 family)
MGTANSYRCEDCRHDFSASEDFSFGFSGDVVTPVVCARHGLVEADTGINVARGDAISSAVKAKAAFPCPKCGADSPRWDRRSCPRCGGRHLDFAGQIMWD